MKLIKICTFMSFLLAANITYAAETTVFDDNFEKGLQNWVVKPTKYGKVKIEKSKDFGNCAKISQEKRRGWTKIVREFPVVGKGDYRFEVMIKSNNVVPNSKSYQRGKFQVVIFQNGKNISAETQSYPADDFEGSFGWKPHTFIVNDLEGNEKLQLRIGLQDAKGSFCVSKVKVV